MSEQQTPTEPFHIILSRRIDQEIQIVPSVVPGSRPLIVPVSAYGAGTPSAFSTAATLPSYMFQSSTNRFMSDSVLQPQQQFVPGQTLSFAGVTSPVFPFGSLPQSLYQPEVIPQSTFVSLQEPHSVSQPVHFLSPPPPHRLAVLNETCKLPTPVSVSDRKIISQVLQMDESDMSRGTPNDHSSRPAQCNDGGRLMNRLVSYPVSNTSNIESGQTTVPQSSMLSKTSSKLHSSRQQHFDRAIMAISDSSRSFSRESSSHSTLIVAAGHSVTNEHAAVESAKLTRLQAPHVRHAGNSHIHSRDLIQPFQPAVISDPSSNKYNRSQSAIISTAGSRSCVGGRVTVPLNLKRSSLINRQAPTVTVPVHDAQPLSQSSHPPFSETKNQDKPKHVNLQSRKPHVVSAVSIDREKILLQKNASASIPTNPGVHPSINREKILLKKSTSTNIPANTGIHSNINRDTISLQKTASTDILANPGIHSISSVNSSDSEVAGRGCKTASTKPSDSICISDGESDSDDAMDIDDDCIIIDDDSSSDSSPQRHSQVDVSCKNGTNKKGSQPHGSTSGKQTDVCRGQLQLQSSPSIGKDRNIFSELGQIRPITKPLKNTPDRITEKSTSEGVCIEGSVLSHGMSPGRQAHAVSAVPSGDTNLCNSLGASSSQLAEDEVNPPGSLNFESNNHVREGNHMKVVHLDTLKLGRDRLEGDEHEEQAAGVLDCSTAKPARRSDEGVVGKFNIDMDSLQEVMCDMTVNLDEEILLNEKGLVKVNPVTGGGEAISSKDSEVVPGDLSEVLPASEGNYEQLLKDSKNKGNCGQNRTNERSQESGLESSPLGLLSCTDGDFENVTSPNSDILDSTCELGEESSHTLEESDPRPVPALHKLDNSSKLGTGEKATSKISHGNSTLSISGVDFIEKTPLSRIATSPASSTRSVGSPDVLNLRAYAEAATKIADSWGLGSTEDDCDTDEYDADGSDVAEDENAVEKRLEKNPQRVRETPLVLASEVPLVSPHNQITMTSSSGKSNSTVVVIGGKVSESVMDEGTDYSSDGDNETTLLAGSLDQNSNVILSGEKDIGMDVVDTDLDLFSLPEAKKVICSQNSVDKETVELQNRAIDSHRTDKVLSQVEEPMQTDCEDKPPDTTSTLGKDPLLNEGNKPKVTPSEMSSTKADQNRMEVKEKSDAHQRDDEGDILDGGGDGKHEHPSVNGPLTNLSAGGDMICGNSQKEEANDSHFSEVSKFESKNEISKIKVCDTYPDNGRSILQKPISSSVEKKVSPLTDEIPWVFRPLPRPARFRFLDRWKPLRKPSQSDSNPAKIGKTTSMLLSERFEEPQKRKSAVTLLPLKVRIKNLYALHEHSELGKLESNKEGITTVVSPGNSLAPDKYMEIDKFHTLNSKDTCDRSTAGGFLQESWDPRNKINLKSDAEGDHRQVTPTTEDHLYASQVDSGVKCSSTRASEVSVEDDESNMPGMILPRVEPDQYLNVFNSDTASSIKDPVFYPEAEQEWEQSCMEDSDTFIQKDTEEADDAHMTTGSLGTCDAEMIDRILSDSDDALDLDEIMENGEIATCSQEDIALHSDNDDEAHMPKYPIQAKPARDSQYHVEKTSGAHQTPGIGVLPASSGTDTCKQSSPIEKKRSVTVTSDMKDKPNDKEVPQKGTLAESQKKQSDASDSQKINDKTELKKKENVHPSEKRKKKLTRWNPSWASSSSVDILSGILDTNKEISVYKLSDKDKKVKEQTEKQDSVTGKSRPAMAESAAPITLPDVLTSDLSKDLCSIDPHAATRDSDLSNDINALDYFSPVNDTDMRDVRHIDIISSQQRNISPNDDDNDRSKVIDSLSEYICSTSDIPKISSVPNMASLPPYTVARNHCGLPMYQSHSSNTSISPPKSIDIICNPHAPYSEADEPPEHFAFPSDRHVSEKIYKPLVVNTDMMPQYNSYNDQDYRIGIPPWECQDDPSPVQPLPPAFYSRPSIEHVRSPFVSPPQQSHDQYNAPYAPIPKSYNYVDHSHIESSASQLHLPVHPLYGADQLSPPPPPPPPPRPPLPYTDQFSMRFGPDFQPTVPPPPLPQWQMQSVPKLSAAEQNEILYAALDCLESDKGENAAENAAEGFPVKSTPKEMKYVLYEVDNRVKSKHLRINSTISLQSTKPKTRGEFHGRTLLWGKQVPTRHIPLEPIYLSKPFTSKGVPEEIPRDPRPKPTSGSPSVASPGDGDGILDLDVDVSDETSQKASSPHSRFEVCDEGRVSMTSITKVPTSTSTDISSRSASKLDTCSNMKGIVETTAPVSQTDKQIETSLGEIPLPKEISVHEIPVPGQSRKDSLSDSRELPPTDHGSLAPSACRKSPDSSSALHAHLPKTMEKKREDLVNSRDETFPKFPNSDTISKKEPVKPMTSTLGSLLEARAKLREKVDNLTNSKLPTTYMADILSVRKSKAETSSKSLSVFSQTKTKAVVKTADHVDLVRDDVSPKRNLMIDLTKDDSPARDSVRNIYAGSPYAHKEEGEISDGEVLSDEDYRIGLSPKITGVLSPFSQALHKYVNRDRRKNPLNKHVSSKDVVSSKSRMPREVEKVIREEARTRSSSSRGNLADGRNSPDDGISDFVDAELDRMMDAEDHTGGKPHGRKSGKIKPSRERISSLSRIHSVDVSQTSSKCTVNQDLHSYEKKSRKRSHGDKECEPDIYDEVEHARYLEWSRERENFYREHGKSSSSNKDQLRYRCPSPNVPTDFEKHRDVYFRPVSPDECEKTSNRHSQIADVGLSRSNSDHRLRPTSPERSRSRYRNPEYTSSRTTSHEKKSPSGGYDRQPSSRSRDVRSASRGSHSGSDGRRSREGMEVTDDWDFYDQDLRDWLNQRDNERSHKHSRKKSKHKH